MYHVFCRMTSHSLGQTSKNNDDILEHSDHDSNDDDDLDDMFCIQALCNCCSCICGHVFYIFSQTS